MSGDAARLSRSGETHFLGKCDEELAVSLPASMKADLAAVAALMSPPRTASEMARMVLSDWMYGRKAAVQRIVGQ